jgi:dTDP-4-amino-4,6-dideoxygalactose transaminase
MVLAAIGAGPGKEVVTTPFTFVGTIEAILLAGGQPVFADIIAQTLNLDPAKIEPCLNPQTAAVMPVDIAGNPADYGRIAAICNEADVPLVSDAAQSIAGLHRGKSVPSHVDAAVFSFYSTKNLTCGEGGMVVSRHKELIDAVRLLSLHGLTSGTLDRNKNKKWRYDVKHLGFKANMSDIHAAVGLGELTVLDDYQRKRTKLAERYIDNLSDLSELVAMPVAEENSTHGWHLFIARLQPAALTIDRDRFIELMLEAGVECGVHYLPVFELSYYRQALQIAPENLPNAAVAGRSVVSLPLHPGLKLTEVDFVCECIRTILLKHRK